jgi:DNA-binding transcriptional LysR family regulator
MQQSAQRPVARIEHTALLPKIGHFSWDDFRIFLACAEAASFRKAAITLGLSSSTVVRRIERLESALGTRLFERVPDGIALTGEGNSLLQNARQMEQAIFDVIHKQAAQDVTACGPVSISITEGLGSYWVMPRLVEFQRQYPFIIINLRCAMDNADVLRLEADMAIQFSKPTNQDLKQVKLGRMHTHAFASKRYLETYGMPETAADLREHRFVQQIAPGLDDSAFAGFFGLPSVEKMVGIRTNTSTAHFYAVEKGAGIGVLPTFAAALGAPVVPLDIGGRYHLDIWLTYHPDARKTPRRALVIDWLKRIFDPKLYPWFRDDFIHPSKLAEHMPPEAKANIGSGFFSANPV